MLPKSKNGYRYPCYPDKSIFDAYEEEDLSKFDVGKHQIEDPHVEDSRMDYAMCGKKIVIVGLPQD